MLTSIQPKPIRKFHKINFVNLTEQGHYSVLCDLVLQALNAQGSPCTVRLRYPYTTTPTKVPTVFLADNGFSWNDRHKKPALFYISGRVLGRSEILLHFDMVPRPDKQS
jgi:hypothetical protein